jgi:hypothetical protein
VVKQLEQLNGELLIVILERVPKDGKTRNLVVDCEVFELQLEDEAQLFQVAFGQELAAKRSLVAFAEQLDHSLLELVVLRELLLV